MQISNGGMLSGKYMIQINQNVGAEGKLKRIFKENLHKDTLFVINCVEDGICRSLDELFNFF